MSNTMSDTTVTRPTWATETDYDLCVHSGEVTVNGFVVWLSQGFGPVDSSLEGSGDWGLVGASLPGDTAPGTVLPPAPGCAESSAAQCRGLAAALLKAATIIEAAAS
jgi:hypothetical protein